MFNDLNYVLENYIKENKGTVDKHSECFKRIVKDLPLKINCIINDEQFTVSGSIGKGNISEVPWIVIRDERISTSATRGLYIVILFRKDMSGFYLTLNQGITYFKNNFNKKLIHYNASKVARYFNGILDEEPSKIKLNSKGVLSKGYEQTTICEKFYNSIDFDIEDLKNDIMEYIEKYKYLIDNILPKTYEQVVAEVLQNQVGIPKYIPSKAAEVVKITIATQDGEVVITEEDLKNKARSVNNVDHKTVSHTIYSRNDFVREYTKHRAKGKCDLCHNDAPFLNKDNKPYLETHHLIMLS